MSEELSVEQRVHLLASADDQFNALTGEVLSSLDFGFKLSIGMLIVLIVLAAQNFNSMRMAIKKKMIDLAKARTAHRNVLAYLETVDLAGERRTAALNLAGSIAFAILMTGWSS